MQVVRTLSCLQFERQTEKIRSMVDYRFLTLGYDANLQYKGAGMSEKSRKSFTSQLKAKVAIEAIRENGRLT